MQPAAQQPSPLITVNQFWDSYKKLKPYELVSCFCDHPTTRIDEANGIFLWSDPNFYLKIQARLKKIVWFDVDTVETEIKMVETTALVSQKVIIQARNELNESLYSQASFRFYLKLEGDSWKIYWLCINVFNKITLGPFQLVPSPKG
jgi:hypothetical protein